MTGHLGRRPPELTPEEICVHPSHDMGLQGFDNWRTLQN